jgi:CRP/FNR family cyclic AMP-dependent transcriptional regulator
VAATRRTAAETSGPGGERGRSQPGTTSLSDVGDAEFLHTLTPTESDALEDMGEPGTFAAGTVIFKQGGTPDCILLVRGGRVRVAARGAGGEEIVLAERGPGELLGDLSGIDGQPRSASVTALEDVRGLIVPLRAFRGFLMDNPRAAISLLELISRRLREAEARQIS